MFRIISVLALILIPFSIFAADDEVSLTIYSKSSPGAINADMYRPVPGGSGYYRGNNIAGYAIVRQKRTIKLENSQTEISFDDVSAYIDPTTVMFKSITHPNDTHVIEQDYKFDLVNKNKLLNRFLGKNIKVEQLVGDSLDSYEGKLLSTLGNSLIVKQKDGRIRNINSYSNIIFPDLPGGLIAKPTLSWLIDTQRKGNHDVEVSYRTSALTWWADYNLIYREDSRNANKGEIDISAWVSIINQSGMSYNNANLKLVAGDVQTLDRPRPKRAMYANEMLGSSTSGAAGFAEKSFFEYHLYNLGRKTTIPDNSTKQIELFSPINNVSVNKRYIYDIHKGNKVGVYLKFKNSEINNMGIPLPSGRVRVSKKDEDDGNLEFIGESVIDHTAKDEDLEIKLGNAFDVVAERKVLNSINQSKRRNSSETIEITLKNRKEVPIEVDINEHLSRYKNWQVVSNHNYKKESTNKISFIQKLRAGQEKKIEYTVNYSW